MTAYTIGVDEAGRGASLGPLVVVAAAIPHIYEEELVRLGIKDSKQFTGDSRNRFQSRERKFYQMVELLGSNFFADCRASAALVDSYVSPKDKTIDELERRLAAEAVSQVKAQTGGDPEKIIFDSHNIFHNITLDVKGEIIAENKADEKYVAVSAASVVAKYMRDKAVRELMGDSFWKGGGYPNMYTARWVRANSQSTSIRRSWSWFKKLKIEK